MKRRINKKNLIVIIIILFISIGFAYLSTTLNISGITNIKSNNWNIYYDNIQYIRGQEFELVSPTTSGTNTTNISYTINLLEPGDVYKFNVDIVNGGTIDAMVKVVTDTALTEEQEKYASYYVTYNDGISVEDYQLLPHGETDTLSVMVAYKKDITEEELPSEDKSITIKFHLEYEQASSTATERNHITVVNRADESKLSVGDELAIDTEHFYVISTDEEKTILMTKYNLNVGNNTQEGTLGIQNKECLGWNWEIGVVNNYSPCTVTYSTTAYWMDDNNQILSKYGTIPYDNDIYDNNFISKTGSNYSVAYYVKEYANYLKNLKLKIIKERILSYLELVSLGCDAKKGRDFIIDNNEFAYFTSYWCSSVGNSDSYLLSVNRSGMCGINRYSWGNDRGVRPVIEIPSLDI